jgi:hypothetical protein
MIPWRDWSPMGNIMNIDEHPDEYIEKEDQEKMLQEKCLSSIFEAYHKSSNDFFEEYAGQEGWPEFVKNWNRKEYPWMASGISFLRYDPTTYNYDKKNNKPGLAMDYHTDSAAFNEIDAGKKFVATVTMYLNDDYDGGEISFFDEKSGTVVNHKPKAGDVTVFPSGYPYFHGVLPVLNNERYILRMFWYYYFEGTEEWKEGLLKYGEEEWARMHKEYQEKEFNSGKYHRVLVYPGEEYDEVNQRSMPFYIKDKNDRG